MHRLQHLRERRQQGRAHPLHAEPHHGRGVAARLAPGDDRAAAQRAGGAGRGRRPGRAGMRAGAGPRGATVASWSRRGTSWAAGWRWRRALPGLGEWRRVVDWRVTQIEKLRQRRGLPGQPHAGARMCWSPGIEHVILATGATWRRDGVGRTLWRPVPGQDLPHVFTPGRPDGRRAAGGAGRGLRRRPLLPGRRAGRAAGAAGLPGDAAHPAPMVSYWTQFTLEQERIERRLLELGVAC